MEEVVKRLTLAVYEIYIEIIESTEKKICASISNRGKIDSCQVIIHCMNQMLEGNIWRLLNKTFVYEFHRYRTSVGLPADKNSTKAFIEYVGKLNREEIGLWFEKYPVLENMVRNNIQNTCDYIMRVLGDYYMDYEELISIMGITNDAMLIELKPMNSDPHNKGTMVLFAKFSDGHHVIYKARSFGADLLIKKIFQKIIVFHETEGFFPVPECINKDNHGWTNYIDNTPIDEENISDALYRLGLYTPIFSCFGATDMHDENIIFDGVDPYFIDLETVMQPARTYSEGALFDNMQKSLSNSIANTSIIPAKLLANTLNCLIGAINTPYPQETEQMVFNFRNIGTDAIDIAKEKVIIDRIANPIKLKSGNVIDPVDYMNDFMRGYRKGYLKILNNKNKIVDLLENFNEPLRIVLRPTTQYFMILDACLFPENLTSEEAVRKILGYMKPLNAIEDPEEARIILTEEWNTLLLGEIPYFYISGKERGVLINDYTSSQLYDYSPVENVIENLSGISEERLMFDERLIVEGYSEIKNKNYKKNKKKYKSESELFGGLWNGLKNCDADAIYDFYNKLAVKAANNGKTEAGWFGGVYGELPISYNSISLTSFHDTGGIPVMIRDLAHYAEIENKHSDVKKYWKLYDQAINGAKTQKKVISENGGLSNVSIISGKPSLDILPGHNTDERERTAVIVDFLKENIDSKIGDVYNGKVGLYLYLASCKETSIDLMKEADREMAEDLEREFERIGIAHGKLGVLWTKFRVCRFLNDVDCCMEIYRQVRIMAESANTLGNGWCNGNSGLLMILAEMMTMPEIKKRAGNILKELAITTAVVPENRMIDLSICHGVAGVIQSLIFCYVIHKEQTYLEIADKYWKKVCKAVDENSYYTGEPNRDYLMGYFLGWSGIIDSVMLLNICKKNDEKSEEELWIPINLSSLSYQKELKSGGNAI